MASIVYCRAFICNPYEALNLQLQEDLEVEEGTTIWLVLLVKFVWVLTRGVMGLLKRLKEMLSELSSRPR